ncbi:hypothetical protein [Ottowia thiooxydans]|uniref:Uncharacterized protein n=1 Tax=Ottowia thiooxydans TaxID=219182 RepID=A0ABV2QC29_9BURK
MTIDVLLRSPAVGGKPMPTSFGIGIGVGILTSRQIARWILI